MALSKREQLEKTHKQIQSQMEELAKDPSASQEGSQTLSQFQKTVNDLSADEINQYCGLGLSQRNLLEIAIAVYLNAIRLPRSNPAVILSMIQMLFEKAGVDVNSVNPYTHLPLLHQALPSVQVQDEKQLQHIEKLLKLFYDCKQRQVNFNERDGLQQTAMHYAANKRNFSFIPTLYHYGCGLNRLDKEGNAVVDCANNVKADTEDMKMIEDLGGLSRSIVGTIAAKELNDAINRFHRREQERKVYEKVGKEVAEKIKKGQLNQVDFNGSHTAFLLDKAVDNEMQRRNLNKADQEINAKNAQGETKAHYAVKAHNPEELARLYQRGADLTIKNADGATPIDLLIKTGQMTSFCQNAVVRTAIQSLLPHETLHLIVREVNYEQMKRAQASEAAEAAEVAARRAEEEKAKALAAEQERELAKKAAASPARLFDAPKTILSSQAQGLVGACKKNSLSTFKMLLKPGVLGELSKVIAALTTNERLNCHNFMKQIADNKGTTSEIRQALEPYIKVLTAASPSP